ncbi:MAG: transporter substrate-binding domain-containing protein [Oscillospiraceae bacterium]|nr:transporter substrate-binding domain-containing protein [Oscillospiraceae bacterium]MBR2739178.1 transporter substrate-binding domain-containing protein [Oscillospiraceae bacterium]
MKKFIALMMLLLIAFSLASCGKKQEDETPASDMETIKASGKLRVGMECDYAPFNWMVTNPTDTSEKIQSGGYADGYDIYFSRMIAEALGVEVEVVKLEWNGLTLALEAGTIDLIIAGMSPTEERKQTVDFTDAYYRGKKVIVVRNDSRFLGAKSLDELDGITLSAQLNSLHYDLIDQVPGAVKGMPYENSPAKILAVQSGVLDGFVEDIDVAKAVVETNPDLTYITFEDGKGFNVDETKITNAIGCRKGSDMVEFINAILAKVSTEEREALMDKARRSQPVIADGE